MTAQTSIFSQDWPALSVRQPWTELLVSGRKTIEIRSWPTDYRGRIWLHAAIKRDDDLSQDFGFGELYGGGFVGSIELLAVVPLTQERWMQWRDKHLDRGTFRSGLVAWLVDAPKRFPMPIPSKGQVGLFRPPADLAQRLSLAESASLPSSFTSNLTNPR